MMVTRNIIPWHWNRWPLKRLFLAITALVLLFLATVLALGVRQFLLYRQCSQAVEASDRLLFQFTAIKDHLNHSLVLGEEVDLRSLDGDLQQMEKEAQELAGNILVPEGMKMYLPSRVDLVGLEVRFRAIQGQRQQKIRETDELVHTLGSINTGLQQFRFALGDHTQSILLGLHKIIAGALGMIVVLTCVILYLVNANLAAPILALCRLTAPNGEGEENREPSCSLDVLLARMRTVLAQQAACPEKTSPVDPGQPDRIKSAALLYRYGVTGCIGTELASELANRINGVINYSQALIDLNEQDGSQRQRAAILPSLVGEAHKTGETIRALQRIGQWQRNQTASLPLPILFQCLSLVLEKPMRAESITLRLPSDCPYEAMITAGDLWLIVLTIIQLGRRILHGTTRPTPEQSTQWLAIEYSVTPGENQRLALLLSHSKTSWEEEHPDPLWPSLAFCAQLLQTYGATLTIAPDAPHLRIDLPCRSSVA